MCERRKDRKKIPKQRNLEIFTPIVSEEISKMEDDLMTNRLELLSFVLHGYGKGHQLVCP